MTQNNKNKEHHISTAKRIMFWSIAALFYFYEVILRVAPSGITDILMQDFKLTCTDLGFMIGSYYWAYTLLQIPCGFIVDKLGSRRVIAFSALICALGTFIFATSPNLYIASFGRILVGAGSACAFISSLKVATDWFSPLKFSLFAGLTNMMGTLGGNFAGLPLSKLMHNFGWITIFNALVIIGLIVALIAYFLLEDKKQSENVIFLSVRRTLKDIISNKQIWLAGVIGGFSYLPITAVAELWGVPYLTATYGIPNDQASLSTNLVFIGTAVGSPLFALVALKLNSYKKTLQIATIFTLVFFIAFSNAKFLDINIIWGTLFLIGLMTGAQVLVFSIAKEESNEQNSATIMGFTNALISFFGIIFQPLMGMILDLVWDGTVDASGLRVYHMDHYQQAMYAMLFAITASFLLIQKLKNR